MSLRTIHADCRDGLKEIETNSVQCCVTSPPYWGLRSYLRKNHPMKSREIGQEKTPGAFVQALVDVFSEVHRVLKDDGTVWLNLGDSYAGSGKGRGGCGPSSAKQNTNRGAFFDGPTSFNLDGLKSKDLIGVPWRVALALQSWGWYLRSDIIWAKPNCMPESVKDRPTRSHEYIFLLTKQARYYYDADAIKEQTSESFANDSRWDTGSTDANEKDGYADAKAQNPKSVHRIFNRPNPDRNDLGASNIGGNGRLMRNKRSVWTVSPASYSESHFATFPPELIKPCILAGSRAADTVLDTFGGSGTTAQVALQLGRKAIVCELNDEYLPLIERRTFVTPGLAL